MRGSPALNIIPTQQGAGADIHGYDPVGMDEAKKLLVGTAYHTDTYGPMEGANVVVIVTEWSQFRAIDFERLREPNKTPTVVDRRNVYSRDDMIPDFARYFGVGRG